MPGPFGMSNAGLAQFEQAKTNEVKLQAVVRTTSEKTRIIRILHGEVIEKIRANLIGALTD